MKELLTASQLGDAIAAHCPDPTATVVLTDIDGTLAPIVSDPTEARIPDNTRAAMAQIARQARLSAALTGRTLGVAHELVDTPGWWVAAEHGAIVVDPDGAADIDPTIGAASDQLQLARTMAQTVGWRYEVKESGITIHFRHVADPQATAAQMRSQFATVLDPTVVEVHDARMALEVRPIGVRTKADAVDILVSAARATPGAAGNGGIADQRIGPARLRVLMFGDDRTDLDAFRRLRQLAVDDAGIEPLLVGVMSDERPAELEDSVDLLAAGPADVGSALQALAVSWP